MLGSFMSSHRSMTNIRRRLTHTSDEQEDLLDWLVSNGVQHVDKPAGGRNLWEEVPTSDTPDQLGPLRKLNLAPKLAYA